MPFHEPHGGYTYCALAALSLINGLPKESTKMNDDGADTSLTNGESKTEQPSGITDVNWTTRWLVSQQTAEGAEDDGESDDENDEYLINDVLGNGDRSPSSHELRYAGFAGRPNKPSDTCYAFWIPGSLSILGKLHLHNSTLSRNYLLQKTQHTIGGFGKKSGDPPDVYHSALGLAALALIGEKGLKTVDARVCLSEETVRYVEEGLPWSKGDREKSVEVRRKGVDVG
jgi:geranylgeranyl transferase type-1 subunit beta